MLREELLTSKETARLAKVSVRTLTRWVDKGKFPRPIRVPDENGVLRWVGSEVDMWLSRKRIESEAHPEATAEPVGKPRVAKNTT